MPSDSPCLYLCRTLFQYFFHLFKNIRFARLIKMAGLLREVNFRRLPGQAAAYHVDTTDERGTRFLFTVVRQEEGGWKLVSPSLPAWIEAAEGLLSAAIGEQEAGAEEEGKRTT